LVPDVRCGTSARSSIERICGEKVMIARNPTFEHHAPC
jgi:hypothetical protein